MHAFINNKRIYKSNVKFKTLHDFNLKKSFYFDNIQYRKKNQIKITQFHE